MEKRTKGKLLQVWGVCGLCLCALLAGLWLTRDNAAKLVRLSAKEDSLSAQKPVLMCVLTNPTPRYVCYGAEFHVERWNEGASAWEDYHVSKADINVTLELRYLRPFGVKREEYPVYIYTDPSGAEPVAPGRYRVVQQVKVGDSVDIRVGEEVTLYCEFTVKES